MGKETIRDRLLKLRGNLSQSEVARRMDEYRKILYPERKPITRNDIANWESSPDVTKRTAIKPADIHLYALALGSDCSYIITGERTKDKTIIADLGLSQKTIDAIRNNDKWGDLPELGSDLKYSEPAITEALNFLFDNGFQNIIVLTAAFLNTDFQKAFSEEITGLINWLEWKFETGKLTRADYEEIPYKSIPFHDVSNMLKEGLNAITTKIYAAYYQYHNVGPENEFYMPHEIKINYPENGGGNDGKAR